MKRQLLTAVLLAVMTPLAFAASKKTPQKDLPYYGTGLCNKPGYHCIKVKRRQSWKSLFKTEKAIDIVQRVNRTNMRLYTGKRIAVPDDLKDITLLDVSPFPKHVAKQDSKLIIVDQNKLAWGAYDPDGTLVKWGPISSGKDFCGDIGRSCNTRTGSFYMFNKKDQHCRSGVYPVGEGGAKMPYCMFFYRGFALHGSHEVPGYRASHGCVRLFTRDAKWLNKQFVTLNQKNGAKGTKVIVQEFTPKGKKHSAKRHH